VKAVQLGNVNGVTLQYAQGGQGNASVTVDGNTYKVTGTATGIDMANPTQPTNKRSRSTRPAPSRRPQAVDDAAVATHEWQPHRELGMSGRAADRDRPIVRLDQQRKRSPGPARCCRLYGTAMSRRGRTARTLLTAALTECQEPLSMTCSTAWTGSVVNRAVTTVPAPCGCGRSPASWSLPGATVPHPR